MKRTSSASDGQNANASDAAVREAQQRLQLLVSVAMRNSVAALDGYTRRLGSALVEASLQAQGETALALQQAAEKLSRERASFQRLFSDCLQQAFAQEAQGLFARRKSRLRNDALDLSLNSFDAMERKVALDNIAQVHDRANAELLTLLQARIAHWLERDAAGLRNPFRAELFLQAALDAWSRFEAAPEAEAVLQRQLGPDTFLPLDAILAALDEELAAREVPAGTDLQYRRRKQLEGATMLGLLHAERRLLGRGGAVFDQALNNLAGMGTLPGHTLALLQMLQPPLRALAQADTRFLVNARHPGRRLLQLTIQASLASGPATAQARALQERVTRVASALVRERSSSTLEAACREMDGHLAPLLQALADKRHACIEDAMREEREERAQQQARSEVMARLEGGAVPAFVERFLSEQWVRVLVFARSVHATKPALLPNLVQAMDDLIWSVSPKQDAAERAELEERRRALVALLEAWVKVVKWDGPERERFFSELNARHAQLLCAEHAHDPRAALAESLDLLQRASEHDLHKRTGQAEEEALMPYMHRIDALEPGDWVEFVRNDGSRLHARLAWVSAARSRFVLLAPAANLAFLISERLFAESLRAGRARVVASGEVLQASLSLACEEAEGQ
ncbi:MAG TPA: DUF1631 family protein [Noviherbaspirillum sp.]